MPWSFLIRLGTALLFWRLRGGRGMRGPQGAGRVVRTAAAASPAIAERARDAREAVLLAAQLALALGFGLATALCVAAGTSSAVLSPRWLGIALLVIAAGFALLTVREARVARALVQARRLRRRDRRLRGDVDRLP